MKEMLIYGLKNAGGSSSAQPVVLPENGGFYPLTLSHAPFSPADSLVYYSGGAYGSVPTDTSSLYYRLYIPQSGIIRTIRLTMINSGTFGTAEDSTMAIRLNDATDYTITSALKHNANGGTYELANQSIVVSAGDYVVMKWTCPVWATNPTNVTHTAILMIQS